jgi:hypothetical protein
VVLIITKGLYSKNGHSRMGIVIFVSKPDALKKSSVNDQISDLCEHVIQNDDHFLCTPSPGKLMDLLKIFKENDIVYQFQNFACQT